MFKKLQKLLGIMLLSTLFLAPTYSAYTDSLDNDDFMSLDDDSFMFDLNDIRRFEADNPNLVRKVQADTLTAKLADAFSFAITKPLWQHTQTPKGRDPLYLLPYKIGAIEYGGVSARLFYNMTNRMHVSASSFLDLESIDKFFVEKILIPKILEEVDANAISSKEVFSLLPLFLGMTLQERRTGLLLQGGFTRGPFNIQLHTSLHLAARNFWLGKKDRAEAQKITDQLFPGQQMDDDEFYIIRMGFGDTRLKFGLNTLNMTNFKTDVGLEVIMPTSLFTRSRSIATSVSLDVTNEETLTKTGGNILQGTRDLLLEPKLGNGGHFGLGFFMESKIGIFNNIAEIWTRFSFDKLFNNDQYRLIMSRVTSEFATREKLRETLNNATVETPTVPKTGLEKSEHTDEMARRLGKFIPQFIFPGAYNVEIRPGGVFNAIFGVKIKTKKWEYAFGYDFYARQRERIEKLYNTSVDMTTLRIQDAETPTVEQHKFFSETTFIKKQRNSILRFGWGSDMTLHAHNIGYDWTVFFKVGASF